MASHTKSAHSRATAFARSLVLGYCCLHAASSWAARDAGQMIAQDKANKDVIARRQAAIDAAAGTPPADAQVLPLDHGPRATTTPWLNAQRRQRALEAAASAASPSTLPVAAR